MDTELQDEMRRQMDDEAKKAASELDPSKIENDSYEKARHAQEGSRYQETVITMSWETSDIREYTRDTLRLSERTTTEAPMFSDRWKNLRLYGEITTRAAKIKKALRVSSEQRKGFERDGITIHQLIAKPRGYGVKIEERPYLTTPTKDGEWEAIFGGIAPTEQQKADHISKVPLRNEEIRWENEKIKKANEESTAKDKKYEEDLKYAESNARGIVEELERGARESVTRAKFNTDFERHESAGGSTVEVAKEFLQPKSHHLQAQDFETMFNLPGTEAKEAGDTSLGDAIDLALRAYYIIGLNERKADIERLSKTDGWQKIFGGDRIKLADNTDVLNIAVHKKRAVGNGYDKLLGQLQAGEEYELVKSWKDNRGYRWLNIKTQKGENLTVGADNCFIRVLEGKDIKEWIGDPSKWKPQGERKGMGKEDDVEVENKNGHRGKLTSHGNIWTRKENMTQRRTIRQLVREFVGGPDAEVAEELAHRMFKTLGMAASFGTEEYKKKDDGSDDIAQEGFPESDDLVKLMDTAYWQRKEASGNAPAGAEGLRGKLERMAVDFISFQSSRVDYKGKQVERSFKEQWWGYNLDKSRNLGQMAWREKTQNIMRDWRLRLFFAAREKAGLLDIWTQRKFSPDDLFSVKFFEGMNKAMNILFRNPTVFTNGFLGDKQKTEKGLIGFDDGENGKKRMGEWISNKILGTKRTWWDAVKAERENNWLHNVSRRFSGSSSKRDLEYVEENFMIESNFFV